MREYLHICDCCGKEQRSKSSDDPAGWFRVTLKIWDAQEKEISQMRCHGCVTASVRWMHILVRPQDGQK